MSAWGIGGGSKGKRFKNGVKGHRGAGGGKAMAKEDAFLVDNFKGGVCSDYSDAELMKDDTQEAIRRRAKWENDDYICRGHILNQDTSSKKFLVSNFNNYKMVDSRPIMEQFNELLRKDFKHTLKHGKDDLSLVQLGSHLRIEESLRAQDSNKGKGKEVVGPSVNIT
ncbi:hypothetical protein Tco_0384943 [Tanacetum coccineum]